MLILSEKQLSRFKQNLRSTSNDSAIIAVVSELRLIDTLNAQDKTISVLGFKDTILGSNDSYNCDVSNLDVYTKCADIYDSVILYYALNYLKVNNYEEVLDVHNQ